MGEFHGWRKCVDCGITCTPLNFVDVDSERICLACWTTRANPEHPNLKEIIEKVEAEVKNWKCKKWTRDEYPLPRGPNSVRKAGSRVTNP
jgi:hypothetical protein